MFMALHNLATLLAAMNEQPPKPSMRNHLGVDDPCKIQWSDTLYAARDTIPDIAITGWCNEDTPLTWPQVICGIAGLELGEEIVGEFDLLNDIISKEGMNRVAAYLKLHPDMTEIRKRRIISAFFDKLALEEEIEEELDLAGSTEDLMDYMTEIYDEDMLEVQRIPGVTVIAPLIHANKV